MWEGFPETLLRWQSSLAGGFAKIFRGILHWPAGQCLLPRLTGDGYPRLGEDIIVELTEEAMGVDGMQIDRRFFERFEDTVRGNDFIVASMEAGQGDRVIGYVNREVFDKPTEFCSLDTLHKATAVDRRVTLREMLEKIFGLIPRFKSKAELLEEEFSKFEAAREAGGAAGCPLEAGVPRANAEEGTQDACPTPAEVMFSGLKVI